MRAIWTMLLTQTALSRQTICYDNTGVEDVNETPYPSKVTVNNVIEDSSIIKRKIITSDNNASEVTTVPSTRVFDNITTAMDTLGNITTAMDTLDNITTAMDALDNITTAMDALDNITTAMDALDNITTAMDALGNITTAMDALDNITTAMDALDNITTAMDALNNITTAMDALGNITTAMDAFDSTTEKAATTDAKKTSQDIDSSVTNISDTNRTFKEVFHKSLTTSNVLYTMIPITEYYNLNTIATNLPDNTNMTDKASLMVIGDYVSYVITPFFLATGLFGNVMTVIVMQSRAFSSMTMGTILTALSVSDTTFLLMHLFTKPFIIEIVGMDVRALSDESCKLFFILLKTAKMSSSWFVVLVCLERLVGVWFPLRARMINSRRHVVMAIAAICTTAITFNGFWSFSSKVVFNGTYCLVSYSYPAIAMKTKIFSIVGTLLYAGIPTVLLLIMTPAIIYRIQKQSRIRRQLSTARLSKYDTNQKSVAMLLSVSITYILLAFPIAAVFVVAMVQGENMFQSRDPVISVIRHVAQPLELLNYSINFFLYVAFSSKYRRRIGELICCRWRTGLKEQLTLT
ncbi:uncharacterized protein LOC121368255 [Gigantopelta aegis]|uniref:uncharacterized protein LOC121368255 n=1 Tax=Gigantopelta aegis TaxID=1735272 RepID=UPI001B88891F|nr:uncharacterized protein LOC121368255 [Gigantopelta aegis]